jgi:peptidoglycan/LPS O-acetylase OafA/YrhL
VLLHLGQPISAEFARRSWEVFGWRTALSVAIAALVGLLLHPLPGFLWLGSRPLVWLGELSYGIYLWHLVVQSTLHRLLPDMFVTAIGSFVALLISLAITLVLAMMSYYWLERPILDRFARHRRARAATELATP